MNWLTRLSRGFGYLTLDPPPRLRRLREEAERGRQPGPVPFGPLPPLPDSAYPPGAVALDTANVKYAYYCRECRGTLFRVGWYIAPRAPDGSPRPPGWAIECAGCGRVTLIPEAPDGI